MFSQQLTQAVDNFSSLMLPLSDRELEIEWKWKDHDEEGIRFAFFVTLQELHQLAVTLSTLLPKPTPAQHILSHYHAAYLDLQAALVGLSIEDSLKKPAEGEWSIKETYTHILGTDLGFTAVVRYALEHHRNGDWTAEKMSDEDADRLVNLTDEDYGKLISDSLEAMQKFHQGFHLGILQDFARIADPELDLPSTFWEETRFPIRHRLHRYEAHFIQHTVQIDKTFIAIGQASSESKQLIRKIYAALAEAEGMMIGAEIMDEAVILETASSIAKRTEEIERILRSN